MRFRAFLCFLVVFLSIIPTQAVLGAPAQDEWQPVEPGIDYREYTLPGPNRVFVARMDLSREDLILDTSIGQGRLAYGTEKVSAMAARYDEALNFWKYQDQAGYRNHVAVAINGSFLNPGTSVPYSGVIQSGWYAKRFDNFSGVSFGWQYDANTLRGKAYIGDCMYHEPDKQYIINRTNYPNKILINGINISRPADSMILYTPQYDRSTWTASDGIEVLVEMNRPNMILSEPRGALGTVVEIRDQAGSTPIPFDHIVLSAHGSAAESLRSSVKLQDVIEISQEIKNLINNCTFSVPDPDWTKTYAGITGDHTYLVNGMVIAHPNAQKNRDVHPRTAIAFNDQYIYFIVVDGRQPGVSVGMTYVQLGEFSVSQLQAVYGMALDGGGSSTMLINDKVVNIPSDRCNPLYLPVLSAPSRFESSDFALMEAMVVDSMMASSVPPSVCERYVGSGVMMIVLQPNQRSYLFEPGNSVLTAGDAQVRLGPGTNYGLLATITQGQTGTIIPHAKDLNGVYAKGKHWWKVSFGSVKGWVSEESLMIQPGSGTPN